MITRRHEGTKGCRWLFSVIFVPPCEIKRFFIRKGEGGLVNGKGMFYVRE